MNFVKHSIGYDYNLGYNLSEGYRDIGAINITYISDILTPCSSKSGAGPNSISIPRVLVTNAQFQTKSQF